MMSVAMKTSNILLGVSMALYVSCVQETPPGGQPSLWSRLKRSDQADTCFSLETAAAAALYSWKGSAERCDKVGLPLIFTQVSLKKKGALVQLDHFFLTWRNHLRTHMLPLQGSCLASFCCWRSWGEFLPSAVLDWIQRTQQHVVHTYGSLLTFYVLAP